MHRRFTAVLFLILLAACAPRSQPAPPQQTQAPARAERITLAPTRTTAPLHTSTMPIPTPSPDNRITDRETVLKNCAALLAAFQEKLQTTGWIRMVFTSVYFDNREKVYWDPQVKEEWYRFDGDGRFVEGYNWLSTPDGTVLQEAIYQGGAFYNLTFGGSSRSYNDRVDFTGSYLDKLKRWDKIAQETVSYHGADAWKFSMEIYDGGIRTVDTLYIDQESGMIRGSELLVVQPDGSLMLVSGSVDIRFEIDADPPLQRFAELLEKAQRTR